MGQPVHMFLEDFDCEVGGAQSAGSSRSWEPHVPAVRASPATGAQLDEAYAKGLEAGIAEGWPMRETEIERLRAEAELQFDGAKAGFSREVLEQLLEGQARQFEALHNRLADQLLDVLLPVLRHGLMESAIRALVEELSGLAINRNSLVIELSGPREIVERVRRLHMEQSSAASELPVANLRVSHGDTLEVQIKCGETVVETRVQEWIDRITEALR
jgi:hypothetical protein